MTYRSDRRMYLNSDRTRAVEEGDPDSAYLLVAEGGELSDQEAKQYGLAEKPKTAAEVEVAPEPRAQPETKAVSAPPENKAKAMQDSKGK